ncbi:hypothetical protein KL909_004033 [Ogataea angusta]|nr:hypothetical protein KL909_004033 [Ogataea angusta]
MTDGEKPGKENLAAEILHALVPAKAYYKEPNLEVVMYASCALYSSRGTGSYPAMTMGQPPARLGLSRVDRRHDCALFASELQIKHNFITRVLV